MLFRGSLWKIPQQNGVNFEKIAILCPFGLFVDPLEITLELLTKNYTTNDSTSKKPKRVRQSAHDWDSLKIYKLFYTADYRRERGGY